MNSGKKVGWPKRWSESKTALVTVHHDAELAEIKQIIASLFGKRATCSRGWQGRNSSTAMSNSYPCKTYGTVDVRGWKRLYFRSLHNNKAAIILTSPCYIKHVRIASPALQGMTTDSCFDFWFRGFPHWTAWSCNLWQQKIEETLSSLAANSNNSSEF